MVLGQKLGSMKHASAFELEGYQWVTSVDLVWAQLGSFLVTYIHGCGDIGKVRRIRDLVPIKTKSLLDGCKVLYTQVSY